MATEFGKEQLKPHYLDFEDAIDMNQLRLELPEKYEQWLSRLVRKGLLVRKKITNPDGSLKEISIIAPFDILGPDDNVVFKKDTIIDYRTADATNIEREAERSKLESSFKNDGEGVGAPPLP